MKRLLAIGVLLVTCTANPHEAQISASKQFNTLYAKLPVRIHGNAAGEDCAVLVVSGDVQLDSNEVEKIHYGMPDYDPYAGGVKQFAADHGFHAVTYKDAKQRLWMFGAISEKEAQTVKPCS